MYIWPTRVPGRTANTGRTGRTVAGKMRVVSWAAEANRVGNKIKRDRNLMSE